MSIILIFMTSLSKTKMQCSCGEINTLVYYSSFGLDYGSEIIKELLNGQFNTFKCKNCGQTLRVASNVMINGPEGVFWFNTMDTKENIKKILIKNRLITENEELYKPLLQKLSAEALNKFIEQKNLSKSDKDKLKEYYKKKNKFDLQKRLRSL